MKFNLAVGSQMDIAKILAGIKFGRCEGKPHEFNFPLNFHCMPVLFHTQSITCSQCTVCVS